VILTKEDGKKECIGTGFITVANGRQAHLVTAAHVVHQIKTEDRPIPRHSLSTPDFFRAAEYRIELRRVIPQALFYDSEGGSAYPALIEAFLEMPKAELAICSITFGTEVPNDVRFETRLALNTTPVAEGDTVISFGYANMITAQVADATFSFQASRRYNTGKVLRVFPTVGPTGQKHPCFQVDTPYYPGMSGGPVMTIEGESPYVRGIIRSDATFASEPVETVISQAALATMVWPLMMMPVSLPAQNGTIDGRTLMDLQREGTIIDRGNAAEHIKVTRNELGQIVDAHWE
jgi:hypothetical protein